MRSFTDIKDISNVDIETILERTNERVTTDEGTNKKNIRMWVTGYPYFDNI